VCPRTRDATGKDAVYDEGPSTTPELSPSKSMPSRPGPAAWAPLLDDLPCGTASALESDRVVATRNVSSQSFR
jgi:hypothetical protein